MIKREAGFSLIELLIAMTIFILILSAASSVFTSLLTQFKQQSKITETQIEGIIGLELLRRDIEHAGYGLPWVIPSNVSYWEAVAGYNDCSGAAPCSPPRGILSGNSAGFNGSDELIIKAINVARNDTAQRWTRLLTGDVKRADLSGDTFVGNDRVIIISPGSTAANTRTLVVNSADSTDWDTTYNATSNFAPDDATGTYVIYGINLTATPLPRMPFNRADYYITGEPDTDVPDRCALNTGVLFKNGISHQDGSRADNLPLLDCVADIQVDYRLDMNNDDDIGTTANADGSAIDSSEGATTGTVQATFADAALLRQRLKEVRVYILAHEGQKDPNYTFTNFTCGANCILVGESATLGRNFDISTITDGENYRWKLYTLVVKPNNLR